MRDYPFSFDELFQYSNSDPYQVVDKEFQNLFKSLNDLKEKYHFPAINNDIGSFLSFLLSISRPKKIFEMGSGYGHSCFWYLISNVSSIEQIILTERRDDLESEFHNLPWPSVFKKNISYHQADAFEVLEDYHDIDFALIDGQKSDYLKFLKYLEPKMSTGGIVAIDNSYWRGSFLDENLAKNKQSAKNIKELHEYIRNHDLTSLFMPYKDGLSLLRF